MTRRAISDLTRRRFLAAAATGAALVVVDGSVFSPREAWALDATALKPATAETLIKVSRDIYPHDRLPDRFYAVAVKAFDAEAAKDNAKKELYENGVKTLDDLAKKAGAARYADMGWENDRLPMLHKIESTPFFSAVRSSLIVGLYNQKEVWPLFGYEGASADKGGYINRGFSDIDWI